jgi:hypothetical protein
MHDYERVSLDNLGRGAAIERFDDELRRVLENILDPNTTIAKRSVTLKVTIKPDEERALCQVDVDCKSSMAPVRPFKTNMFVGRDSHGVIATEHNPNQMRLDFDVNKPRIVDNGGDK